MAYYEKGMEANNFSRITFINSQTFFFLAYKVKRFPWKTAEHHK